jgi:hypothetical protein
MTHDDEATRKAIASAYSNTWRRENIEARRAYEREHYAKNLEERRDKARERYHTEPADKREARNAYRRAYVQANREAILENKRRYREKNREKLREAHRKYIRDDKGELNAKYRHRHQRKIVQRAIDLETMAGRPRPEVCEICGGPPDPKKGMHYDHCHATGAFRGWICRGCNLMLGHAKDDPSLLLRGAAYLERFQQINQSIALTD